MAKTTPVPKGTPYDQGTPLPTTKVVAGFSWGAITVILAFLLRSIWGIELDAEVSSSLTVLISFLGSYFTRERV